MPVDLRHMQADMGEWHKAYRPKRSRSVAFLFAHLHEEVAEAFKEWRESRFHEYRSADRFGLLKPEGLGSELADVVLDAMTIADLHGLDLEHEVRLKYKYRMLKLEAKEAQARKAKKKKAKKS